MHKKKPKVKKHENIHKKKGRDEAHTKGLEV